MASVTQIIRRRRRRRGAKSASRNQNRNWLLLIFIVLSLATLGPLSVLGVSVVSAYSRASAMIPDPRQTIFQGSVIGATEIYDSLDETLLFSVQDPLGDERSWLSLDELPDYIVDATLLWEDPDFLEVTSFDPVSLLARMTRNFMEGPLDPDSTLTGRLVRNLIMPPRELVTVNERAQEFALVAEINRRYAPDDVLEWHLNTNYYGNEAYGIEAAAQVYFGKSARDLTLDEAAMLATIPTAPRFNPVDDEAATRSRQSDLLRRLLASSAISQAQYEEAVNTFTQILPGAGQLPLVAPEFANYARRQAEAILNALGEDGAEMMSRGGLRITTTLDVDLYYQAECILRTHLVQLRGVSPDQRTITGGECIGAAYLPINQRIDANMPDTGSMVILNAQTGEILAIVGPATRSAYEPGPTLHPFVYLAGLLNGDPNFTAASMLLDISRPFPGAAEGLIYPPQNPDGRFRGPVSLRAAMGAGLLPPATQIAHTLGLNNILRNFAFPLGVTSLTEPTYDLSLLERGGSVSVLELAQAYSVFAALGDVFDIRRVLPAGALERRALIAVKRIEDAEGNVLWSYDSDAIAISRVNLLQSEAAYVVNDILADDSTRWDILGQNNVLELDRPAAVINGLTSDRSDNWTIGYTPSIVTAVHLASTSDGPMALEPFGIEGAGPVWRAVMDYVHARDRIPAQDWQRPESVVEATVCDISGLLPNGVCATHNEIFISESQLQALPTDTYWQQVEINTDNLRRATINTPDALRRQQAYFVPPPEALDWWRLQNLPLPPTDYDTTSRPNVLTSAELLRPENFSIVGGRVEIRGSMNATNMDFYQIAYGQGSNPATWINLTGQETTYTPGTVLATWDTAGLDGTYTLRLLVTNTDRSIEQAFVQVIIDNIAPTLVLNAGEPGQIYNWPENTVIPLEALARDNYRIEKVEFYHNGLFVGVDESAPFGYEHQINRAGIEEFRAVAFDAVGNQTTSVISVEVRRAEP